MNRKLRRFIHIVVVVLFAWSPQVEADDRPNIVLLVADDLGWTGLGCYGSEFYETPNIDRLASEGVRFTSAYSGAANCAPSRATIMSGQYTPAHGILYVGSGTYQERYRKQAGNLKKFRMIQPPGETELPPRELVETVAENLQASGYRTAMFGKWHLGSGDNLPGARGFEVAIESHGKHFGFHTEPETDHPDDQYLSDFLSDRATDFVTESVESKKPFFLYYADFLVHKPFEAKENYLKHFGSKAPSENQRSPMAGAMIKSLDGSVGKILRAIDDQGVREQTVVIFTSDNGGLSYEEDGLRDDNTSNLPLRGRKGSEYEGGIRVPWIVRWPGQVSPGLVDDTPIHQVDLYPTIMAAAGANAPPQSLHGSNLLPLFRGSKFGEAGRALFWYLPGYSSFHEPSVMVRQGDWKLIESLETRTRQLFNLARDKGESRDLGEEKPELAAELSTLANQWLDKLDAPRMVPNPEFENLERQ